MPNPTAPQNGDHLDFSTAAAQLFRVMKFFPNFFVVLGIWLLGTAVTRAAQWRLTVEAGDFDRRDAIVSFQAPDGVRGAFVLHGPNGTTAPLQVEASGRAVFVEPDLAKGARKTYTLAAATELPAAITAEKVGAVLKMSAQPGGAPIFHYQTEPGPVPDGVNEVFRHGAHLHPVFTPGGRVVTGNHPPDHLHQRGVWLAWTKTEFEGRHPDFWNMGKEAGGFTGEVRFAALERMWSGPVQGGFVSRHRFIDHTSGTEKDMLAETWEVNATRVRDAFVIDLVSTQTTAGDAPVKFPKYYYGGLGVRGNAAWDPVDQVTMLTSNGDDRAKGDGTKAKWVHIGGAVDGQPAGVAVLIHPDNFRFPQPLRLNPKNPQICIAPSQDGDWEIVPGKPYVSRYRLIITDGAANKDAIERQWNNYATPPVVELRQE